MIPVYLALMLLPFLAKPFQMTQGQPAFREVARFDAEEAHQGVAVDEHHFYAIADRRIGKYDKKTGRLVVTWEDSEDGSIIHLDSGMIWNGKLFCAHSNYPGVPMTSSIEIWDTDSLKHIGTHSFGIDRGSCTWLDRYNGFWWAAFAHYNKLSDKTHTDNTYSTLVKFDENWQALEAWVYPPEILERLEGMSNSGGSWGPDGRLYLTGHDRGELYAVRLPSAGSALVLEEIIPADFHGQGIAWDRKKPGQLYTISRANHEVIIFEFQH